MADKEHLRRLKEGADAWNTWRRGNSQDAIDLSSAKLSGANGVNLGDADLSNANLMGASLYGANLTRANLRGASLFQANLEHANLQYADLSHADLTKTELFHANLTHANLQHADLSFSNLSAAKLSGANLSEAHINGTIFAWLNLTGVIGLDTCRHVGRSIIDHLTLQLSGPLPLVFLRGVGLPDNLINCLPSLLKQAIQHYSCFISHSAKDHVFAERIHADLQNKGVRCWFAPHDLPIGAKILDGIDEAIRLREKVVLILSKHAIASDWVETEVTTALEEEHKRKQTMLFPIRLDNSVMTTKEAWAAQLRARDIGDFRRWKDHDDYQRSFARVLRDLSCL